MTESAPPLLPIFRSRHQLNLLSHLLLNSDTQFSIATLENETGIPQPTISREVERLAKSGLVNTETLGRMKLVRASRESPYFPELYGLMLKVAGPAVLLSKRLQKINGIQEAFIFGSWARRYSGQMGDAPRDIDVLLVGNPDPKDIEEASTWLERRLGKEVNPVILSPREWRTGKSGFLRQLRKEPLVPLISDVA